MSGPVDFDVVIDRREEGSEKWNVAPGELPMWVADMDFAAAPVILDALRARLDHPVFGYTTIPPAFAEAVAGWWMRRHGWAVEEAWVGFATGVMPAMSSIIRTLAAPGEPVVIAPPVYHIFVNAITNSGREVLASPLRRDPATGWYDVDWDDLAAAFARPDVHLVIWCNPQNPLGRLWSAEELTRLAELAARHGVTVLSDEIHCDLTAPGHGYTPFAPLSPAPSITCVSPTKAFNIAGIQASAVIVPDPALRERVRRGLNRDEVAEPNAFAIDAAIAAFTRGDEWLDAARAYLQANKRHAVDAIGTIPGLHCVENLATYLLWVDISALSSDSVEFCRFLREHTGLYVSDGAQFGGDGAGFLRLNVACPRTLLDDGLDRLRRGVAAWTTHNHTQ